MSRTSAWTLRWSLRRSNLNDEHDRFAQLGRLWREAAEPGSRVWDETLDELVALGTAPNANASAWPYPARPGGRRRRRQGGMATRNARDRPPPAG